MASMVLTGKDADAVIIVGGSGMVRAIRASRHSAVSATRVSWRWPAPGETAAFGTVDSRRSCILGRFDAALAAGSRSAVRAGALDRAQCR